MSKPSLRNELASIVLAGTSLDLKLDLLENMIQRETKSERDQIVAYIRFYKLDKTLKEDLSADIRYGWHWSKAHRPELCAGICTVCAADLAHEQCKHPAFCSL